MCAINHKVASTVGFFKEVGTALRDPQTLQAMGLSLEDGQKLTKRCKKGTIDFVDFLRMVWLLNELGGDLGMVQELSDKRGEGGMPDKLARYKDVLDAMTPKERTSPELFVEGAPQASENCARVEERGMLAPGTVEQFAIEYSLMTQILAQLGTGKSIEQMTGNMLCDMTEKDMASKPRRLRRAVLRPDGKSKKTRAEWMDV